MSFEAKLRGFSIFAGMSDDELTLLAEVARERHYAAGERIIEKDDTGASLFLICQGKVRVVLPKQDREDIELNLLQAGEFFGEMSLFDGKPRSAIVYADTDTTVIEVQREQFLDQVSSKPDLALKILSVMADRVRHSDDRIDEIADRVYREAYPKIDQVITTQLEAAKVIYEKTEDRAGHVLASVERSWTSLTRFITIILGVVSVAGAALAYFGYTEFNKITENLQGQAESTIKRLEAAEQKVKTASEEVAIKLGEIEVIRKNAALMLNDIQSMSKDASITREVALTIGRIRRDFNLERHQDADAMEQIRWQATHFGPAESQLYESYLEKDAVEKSEPEVVLEAAVTYAEFLQREPPYLPEEGKIEALLYALLNVLEKVKANDWRSRAQVRDTLEALAGANGGLWKDRVTIALRRSLYASADTSFKSDIARVLFGIGVYDKKAREILSANMLGEGSRWQRFGAAAQLVRIRDKEAWKVLLTNVNSTKSEGFTAAYLLGQIEPEKLLEFGVCEHKDLVQSGDPFQEIVNRLQLVQSENPYQMKFIENLVSRIAPHSCPAS
jgi:CRP-like cAMP-binding protein